MNINRFNPSIITTPQVEEKTQDKASVPQGQQPDTTKATSTSVRPQQGAKAKQNSLLAQVRQNRMQQKETSFGGKQASPNVETALNSLLAGGMLGKFVTCLVPGNMVIGPNGHTVDDERKLFKGLQRPGMPDEQADLAKVRAMADKLSPQEHEKVAGDLLTLYMRNDPDAKKLFESGVIPGHTRCGFDSTVAQERQHFQPTVVGF